MRLYDYSEAFVNLERMLMDGTIDEETFKDTLDSLEGGAKEKAENTAKMIDNFKAHAAALKEEEDTLKKKRQTITNRVDWLQNNLETFLKATGSDKMQVGLYTLGYRKLPDIVEFTNEQSIPKAYKRYETVIKVDKNAVARALKDKEKVRGARLVTGRTRFEVKK